MITETQLLLACEMAQRHKSLKAAQWAIEFFGELQFGIESIACAGASLRYVNLGDTYQNTVVQEGREFAVCSWGSWFESVEQEHCENEDVYSCGYCGEFTPRGEDFHSTVCEHCGHKVAG